MKMIQNNFHASIILIFCVKLFVPTINAYYEQSFTTNKANFYNYAQKRNIENSINSTLEPCEDFYEYACGNYIYDNNNKDYHEITQYLDNKFNKKLLNVIKPKGLFKRIYKEFKIFLFQPKQTFVDKMQNYFESCSTERRGNFWKYIKELKVYWPLIQNGELKCETNNKEVGILDFWQLLGQLQSYNCKSLIIQPHIERNSDGFLNIVLAPISYNETNILPEDDFIYDFLKALNVADHEAVVQQLKIVEQNWLEVLENNTLVEENPQEMSLKELLQEYPYFSVYLENLIGNRINRITNITLITPSFFKYLNETEWSTGEVEQQMNFLMINFFYYLGLDGTTDHTPMACIKDMRDKFDLAANYVYFHEVWLNERKPNEMALNQLKTKIITIFMQYLEEPTLNLTSVQIIKLKNKLQNITLNIGNLPDPADFEQIDKFYQEVPDMAARNYFKNHLLLLKQRFRNSWQSLPNLNFYAEADTKRLTPSYPYYVLHANTIVIPLASLQYPLFHYTYNPLYQMSLMGFILAHEIAHAFDSTFLGNEYNTQEYFFEFLECQQNQEPTEHIDERIADLMAESIVYKAFENYYGNSYDMNWKRYFYLSMAQFFCNNGDLDFLHHDMDDLRLQLIVQNSDHFAEAFNCSLEMPMNPLEKCHLV